MHLRQVFSHYSQKDRTADGFLYCPLCQKELVIQAMDDRYRSVCPRCGFIHHKNPAPAVSVLILHLGPVLLGKRKEEPGKGLWATPSGYIEYEDDFLTTAIREAKEETGLDVEIKLILNVQSSFLSERYHFLGIYLLAEVVGGELSAGDDLEAVAWFPLQGPFPELAFLEDAEMIHAYAHNPFEGLPVEKKYARA
jgi:8-oxo-dGTP diphosphatase